MRVSRYAFNSHVIGITSEQVVACSGYQHMISPLKVHIRWLVIIPESCATILPSSETVPAESLVAKGKPSGIKGPASNNA